MKIYEKTWFIILMLLVFFPVGLFLMWRYSEWNKVVKVIITVLCALALVLYMFGGSSDDKKKTEDKPKAQQEQEVDKTEPEQEQKVEEDSNKSSDLFKDGVYEDDDVKIVITKAEVIPEGDTTYSEYNLADGDVICFWYDITNKTSKKVTPDTQWALIFKAVQDNDPNRVNELDTAPLPDSSFTDVQMEEIKEGGTVSCCWGYTLDDNETPVTLIAQDILGNEKGSQNYDVK